MEHQCVRLVSLIDTLQNRSDLAKQVKVLDTYINRTGLVAGAVILTKLTRKPIMLCTNRQLEFFSGERWVPGYGGFESASTKAD